MRYNTLPERGLPCTLIQSTLTPSSKGASPLQSALRASQIQLNTCIPCIRWIDSCASQNAWSRQETSENSAFYCVAAARQRHVAFLSWLVHATMTHSHGWMCESGLLQLLLLETQIVTAACGLRALTMVPFQIYHVETKMSQSSRITRTTCFLGCLCLTL